MWDELKVEPTGEDSYLIKGLHSFEDAIAAVEAFEGREMDRKRIHVDAGAWRWVPQPPGSEYRYMLYPADERESGFGQFFATTVHWF